MKKFIILLILFVIFLHSPKVFCKEIENVFQRPYRTLLREVASQSAIFNSGYAVERALTGSEMGNRVCRLKKKIAAVRMLVADGRLRADEKVSSRFLNLPVSMLVTAGERYVMLSEKKDSKATSAPMAVSVDEQDTGSEKRDNRFDIFDDDEFNLYDVIAFPFRLIGFILELLFNIVLYPFKLLASIIF